MWRADMRVKGDLMYLGEHASMLEAALARITCEDMCPDWACDARNENRKKIMNTTKKK